jgi:hypothetical protein
MYQPLVDVRLQFLIIPRILLNVFRVPYSMHACFRYMIIFQNPEIRFSVIKSGSGSLFSLALIASILTNK